MGGCSYLIKFCELSDFGNWTCVNFSLLQTFIYLIYFETCIFLQKFWSWTCVNFSLLQTYIYLINFGRLDLSFSKFLPCNFRIFTLFIFQDFFTLNVLLDNLDLCLFYKIYFTLYVLPDFFSFFYFIFFYFFNDLFTLEFILPCKFVVFKKYFYYFTML